MNSTGRRGGIHASVSVSASLLSERYLQEFRMGLKTEEMAHIH